jgi:Fe-S-cluster containining protein
MQNTALRFACNGCGVCCKGRLIPLTLQESRQWLQRGHDVAVILEAFDESLWHAESEKFKHNAKRAAQIHSGNAKINVIAIFAANALAQCPNLDDQDRCGIYE